MTTVNKVPTTNQIRALLADCRRAAVEAVAREAQLARESERRRSVAARAAAQAMAQHDAEVAGRRRALEEAHRVELGRIEARFLSRKDRIQRAHNQSRRRANQRLDQLDGRAVFGFQKGTLDAEKRRVAELTATNDAFNSLSAAIAEAQGRWLEKEAALRRTFGAFALFRRWLSPKSPWNPPDLAPDEYDLMNRVEAAFAELETSHAQARARLLPKLLRLVPFWMFCLLLAGASAVAVFGLPQMGKPAVDAPVAGGGAGAALVVYITLRFVALSQLRRLAERSARRLSDARHWLAACEEKAAARQQAETARIESDFSAATQDIRNRWSWHEREMAAARPAAIESIAKKAADAVSRNERLHAAATEGAGRRHEAATLAFVASTAEARERVAAATKADTARVDQELSLDWAALASEWRRGVGPFTEFLAEAAAAGAQAAPDWGSDYWKTWNPPTLPAGPAHLGTLDLDVRALASAWPVDPRLAFPGPARARLPYWLAYPEEGSVVIETDKTGSEEAGEALKNIALRLLCRMPAGRLKLTILDPVGLGKTFASFMHLADYAEATGGQRIWTEPAEIEERLAELTAHLEKIIQMYLRNEFANLAEYNAQAGTIAEHHRLLVVTGFPVNFSESATRRLLNLITNGGRCGIITLLHWDRRHPAPAGFIADDLRKAGVHLVRSGADFAAVPPFGPGVRIVLDSPPPPEVATALLHRIGGASREANKVVVPFDVIAPPPAEVWTQTAVGEIRTPIGRTGASKLQYLSLGRGTRQHALISGKTGSGKSNLLHVIITNLALRCSPAEIEFYLVDFKKGVEFKSYAAARLPHARVVAIESDREFGLSVLEKLDEELRRRGESFRAVGVQDLPGYRGVGGVQSMPRCLLLVDEFQEFFVQEDRVSQNAAMLLDRIVRQGRAFGVHVILASQTLGGAYALARATLGQMAVRIAFQCDEADAHLIMGDENPAPRLLSRPGEGIYNDAAGALEANSPFQAVLLPDEARERCLAGIRGRADASAWSAAAPVVFEGSAPAQIEDNAELRRCLEAPAAAAPLAAAAWLGAPNSIKGQTAAVFSPTGGSNLLIVGQREESSLSIVASALVSLAAQFPPALARFVVVDTTPPGGTRGDLLERITTGFPHSVERVAAGRLPEALAALATDLDARVASGVQGRPAVFLVIVGLQNCKKLKPDDSFGFGAEPADGSANASAAFQNLYVEGPASGIHTILQVDSYNNANRFLGRKGLSEFEMRVLLQMSASDSSSLADQPGAANLGLYGALYYNDREGRTETFRPYSIPADPWIERLGRLLRAHGCSPSAAGEVRPPHQPEEASRPAGA